MLTGGTNITLLYHLTRVLHVRNTHNPSYSPHAVPQHNTAHTQLHKKSQLPIDLVKQITRAKPPGKSNPD
jgi:hypothetical protein